MKTIIAGSREIEDYNILLKTLKDADFNITEVVSGGCRGPDKLGERWAKENGIPIKHFYAQWKKYGKRAGPIRNLEMVEYADAAIFLWDGRSRGTANCIDSACRNSLHVFIYKIEQE